MLVFRLIVSLVAIVFVIAALDFLYRYNHQTNIGSYQECLDAGYPITTSYPTQCRTPDGRVFVGPSDPHSTDNPSIMVKTPQNGETVTQTFTVTGSARGSWFFEAVFPVKIVDAHGQQIIQTQAHAGGDWMTEDFVPFTADIELPETYSGPATIILEKDNPSGLPERSAAIQVPITIH